jgi:hypothetical protein
MFFAVWVTMASGYQAVYQTMLLLLIGLPIYAFLKARKERHGTAPEPLDNNPTVDIRTVTALVTETD